MWNNFKNKSKYPKVWAQMIIRFTASILSTVYIGLQNFSFLLVFHIFLSIITRTLTGFFFLLKSNNSTSKILNIQAKLHQLFQVWQMPFVFCNLEIKSEFLSWIEGWAQTGPSQDHQLVLTKPPECCLCRVIFLLKGGISSQTQIFRRLQVPPKKLCAFSSIHLYFNSDHVFSSNQ